MLATATLLLITATAWTAKGIMGVQVNSTAATNGRPRDCQDLISQGKNYEGHYVVYPEASAPNKPTMIYCSQDDGMEPLPSDNLSAQNCLHHLQKGMTSSGIYIIYPHLDHPTDPVMVSCDMDTDGGGWTVIQYRHDGSLDFYRTSSEYVNGFGNSHGEHYLGNAIIASLTEQSETELRVELTAWDGVMAYANYQIFYLDSHNDYRLFVGLYDGTAGNALDAQNGNHFSTYDADQDTAWYNCAEHLHGAWWYETCGGANLNGRYYTGNDAYELEGGVYWRSFRGYFESMQSTKMMVRGSPNY